MRFRPCIDLYRGLVVQIVGGSLHNQIDDMPKINFTSDRTPAYFATMYKNDNLAGGHVISLGPGNRDAALSAIRAFPGGLQMGGGITPENAMLYLEAGASHVIVTSYIFRNGYIDIDNLHALVRTIGKERLVIDLSCQKRESYYWVVTDRWQKSTNVPVNEKTLAELSDYCAEFLIHSIDAEGKMQGIQEGLVELLGKHSPIPVTYAGGVSSLLDLDSVKQLGKGHVDVTIGSALDIFGGTIPYRSVVEWHSRQS